MDNNQVTAEWIAQQREKAKDAINLERCAYRQAVRATIINEGYPAALDALEASMQREAEKDATIICLTAERDAEKKRADALAPAIEDMKQALCCSGFGELSAACSELWRIWDQNDPEFAEHTDAPTGAESEADHAE